ncbi:unnamed protein product [Ixodes pacificus]
MSFKLFYCDASKLFLVLGVSVLSEDFFFQLTRKKMILGPKLKWETTMKMTMWSTMTRPNLSSTTSVARPLREARGCRG